MDFVNLSWIFILLELLIVYLINFQSERVFLDTFFLNEGYSRFRYFHLNFDYFI